MASSGSEPLAVPPLPPKLRPKPQRRGNIGAGKRYADEDAFQWDLRGWDIERENRLELVKERERAQERLREGGRDRSERQRDREEETDAERRVRQRRVQESEYRQQRKEEQDQAARVRARGIASGQLVALRRDELQFLDDTEREHFDRNCLLGCPRAAPVFMAMQLYGHSSRDPHRQVHVRVMLFSRVDVRVQGEVVGYGDGGRRVHRKDTCACSACDEIRRGVRVVMGEEPGSRGGWSVFGDA